MEKKNAIVWGGAVHVLVDDDFVIEDSMTCMKHCSLAHMCKTLQSENICGTLFFETGKHFEIQNNSDLNNDFIRG